MNALGARKELHHEARRHDRRDAELHERAAVRRDDRAQPVEGIRGVYVVVTQAWATKCGFNYEAIQAHKDKKKQVWL